MTNPHLDFLGLEGKEKFYSGFGMKSALTERATEPWPKGVHPKEDGVRKGAKHQQRFWSFGFRNIGKSLGEFIRKQRGDQKLDNPWLCDGERPSDYANRAELFPKRAKRGIDDGDIPGVPTRVEERNQLGERGVVKSSNQKGERHFCYRNPR
jgi:hypothetical protein